MPLDPYGIQLCTIISAPSLLRKQSKTSSIYFVTNAHIITGIGSTTDSTDGLVTNITDTPTGVTMVLRSTTAIHDWNAKHNTHHECL